MAKKARHWYVYGFMWTADIENAEVSTICAGVKTNYVRHGDLAAITSSIRGQDFDPDNANNRLGNEEWLKNVVLAHEGVAEAHMQLGPIVPCRFGIIFASPDALVEYMAENHDRLRDLLQNVTGCKEWGVKVFVSRPAARERALARSTELKPLRDKIAITPGGTRYLLERRLASQLETIVDNEIDTAANAIIPALSAKAVAFQVGPVNGPVGTDADQDKELVANVSFLVSDGAFADFRETFAALAGNCGENGIDLRLTGPWPPYHFASE